MTSPWSRTPLPQRPNRVTRAQAACRSNDRNFGRARRIGSDHVANPTSIVLPKLTGVAHASVKDLNAATQTREAQNANLRDANLNVSIWHHFASRKLKPTF